MKQGGYAKQKVVPLQRGMRYLALAKKNVIWQGFTEAAAALTAATATCRVGGRGNRQENIWGKRR